MLRGPLNTILLASLLVAVADAIKCYSCANAFMVLQWRNFFLKRNYGLTESDPACALPEVSSEIYQTCYSTCFVLLLNATHKQSGHMRTLGAVRGCSSQYMVEDQHAHMGLGSYSEISTKTKNLPLDYDQYDLTEHWCYCATEYCNTQHCYFMRPRFRSERWGEGRRSRYNGSLPSLSAVSSLIAFVFATLHHL